MNSNVSFLPINKVMSKRQRLAGWLVHIFTATGAYVGLLALLAIYQHQWMNAFWLMGVSIIIDAVDGCFARMIDIKVAVPNIDGALLDNIVDFFTYTIVPAFFILVGPLVPAHWRFVCILFVTLSSAYQFTQVDAKTEDHFFKGFPSYWNIVVFYLFFWHMSEWVNLAVLVGLSFLSFVPIKYVYPSRLDYLSEKKSLRFIMLLITILWGFSTAGLLWLYPSSNKMLLSISISYMIVYVGISFYRTWAPLIRDFQ